MKFVRDLPCPDRELKESYEEHKSLSGVVKYLFDEYSFYISKFTVSAKLRSIGVMMMPVGGANNKIGKSKLMRVPDIPDNGVYDMRDFANLIGMSVSFIKKVTINGEVHFDERSGEKDKRLWYGSSIKKFAVKRNAELLESLDEKDRKRLRESNSRSTREES